jgi:hypothetical protein
MPKFRTKSEREFYSLFETENKRPATDYEDMVLHFDMVIDDIKIDVKGLKRKNMSDSAVNPEIHWVEFQNVRGDVGWVKGKADKIALEILEGYILIDRIVLYEFCKERVISKKVSNKKELYKLYRRDNQNDVIMLVLTKDLLNLPHELILKP